MARALLALLAAVLLSTAAACNIIGPSENEAASSDRIAFRSDRTSYRMSEKTLDWVNRDCKQFLTARVIWTAENRTGRTISTTGCMRPGPPRLERLDGSSWKQVLDWKDINNSAVCIWQGYWPIEPGSVRRDTVEIALPMRTPGCSAPEPTSGRYRFVMGFSVHGRTLDAESQHVDAVSNPFDLIVE